MIRHTAILTLALTAFVHADEALAQQANAVPLLALSQTAEAGMDDITGMLQRTFTATDDLWLVIDIAFGDMLTTGDVNGDSILDIAVMSSIFSDLVDIGIPEPFAAEMVFEALSIFASIEHSGL